MNQQTPVVEVPPPLLSDRDLAGSDALFAFKELVAAHRAGRAAGRMLKLAGEANEAVLYVISGWVAVSKSMADGHRQILDILLPGDLLNPGSANQDLSAVDIEPLTYVKIAALPRADWLRLLQRHPALGRASDRNAGAARARMFERMLRLGKGNAESLIAYAICELCLRSSVVGLVDEAEFHVPMTQLQLGDFTGLSAVHVCRTLRRFERQGVVDVADHMTIRIRDLDTLAGIAEIDPPALRHAIIPGP